jgi:hypothetical protein
MPVVKPNFESAGINRAEITPGRYLLKVVEITESETTDKNGHNALVWKFEVVGNKNTKLNGRRISRWLPLGGAGSKVLWKVLKTINPGYNGQAFVTNDYLNKTLEADVEVDVNPATQKAWPKITRVYPYIPAGSVGSTLAAATADPAGAYDDFA